MICRERYSTYTWSRCIFGQISALEKCLTGCHLDMSVSERFRYSKCITEILFAAELRHSWEVFYIMIGYIRSGGSPSTDHDSLISYKTCILRSFVQRVKISVRPSVRASVRLLTFLILYLFPYYWADFFEIHTNAQSSEDTIADRLCDFRSRDSKMRPKCPRCSISSLTTGPLRF